MQKYVINNLFLFSTKEANSPNAHPKWHQIPPNRPNRKDQSCPFLKWNKKTWSRTSHPSHLPHHRIHLSLHTLILWIWSKNNPHHPITEGSQEGEPRPTFIKIIKQSIFHPRPPYIIMLKRKEKTFTSYCPHTIYLTKIALSSNLPVQNWLRGATQPFL